MAEHNDLGNKGEKIAVHFLKNLDYKILEENYRYRRAEIDIIAMHKDILVFIEVKSRSADYFGKPESFITQKKEKLMADTASYYMEKIGHDWEIRFDFISILFHDAGAYEIDHFKDAFFPGWV